MSERVQRVPRVRGLEGRRRHLVRPLVTLHSKRVHRSGGELEVGGGLRGPALAPLVSFDLTLRTLGGAVAVADVLGQRVAEGVPVEVVGVLANEFGERAGG